MLQPFQQGDFQMRLEYSTSTDQPSARTLVNRANAQHSTGPRTPEGKARSAQNALAHGLTSETAFLPAEDFAAYQRHTQSLLDEYQPKGPTETLLVQDLADTAWRLSRIPAVENHLLGLSTSLPTGSINVDLPDLDAALAITETLRAQERGLANLSRHGNRLHRQFHKTLDRLRQIQADRREQEKHDLKRAAGVLELHKHKGLPYNPADDGFVFSALNYLTDQTC
jgi:hypothetical protein